MQCRIACVVFSSPHSPRAMNECGWRDGLTNGRSRKLLANRRHTAYIIVTGHETTGRSVAELLHGFRVHRYLRHPVARLLRPLVALFRRRTHRLEAELLCGVHVHGHCEIGRMTSNVGRLCEWKCASITAWPLPANPRLARHRTRHLRDRHVRRIGRCRLLQRHRRPMHHVARQERRSPTDRLAHKIVLLRCQILHRSGAQQRAPARHDRLLFGHTIVAGIGQTVHGVTVHRYAGHAAQIRHGSNGIRATWAAGGEKALFIDGAIVKACIARQHARGVARRLQWLTATGAAQIAELVRSFVGNGNAGHLVAWFAGPRKNFLDGRTDGHVTAVVRGFDVHGNWVTDLTNKHTTNHYQSQSLLLTARSLIAGDRLARFGRRKIARRRIRQLLNSFAIQRQRRQLHQSLRPQQRAPYDRLGHVVVLLRRQILHRSGAEQPMRARINRSLTTDRMMAGIR